VDRHHNGLRFLRLFAGGDYFCLAMVAGGGASGGGNPRKIMMKNIGDKR
jgi:hypothetical protein